MRTTIPLLFALSVCGCTTSRYQVIPYEQNDVILLDTTTGQTWTRRYYTEPGEKVFSSYWKEMPRGRPAGTTEGY